MIAVDDPTPVAAGGAATLRGAGVQVETGVRRHGGGAGQHRLADRGAPRPPVRDLEVRRDPGRALGRRRRHQPVDHLGAGPRRRARAAQHDGRDHGRGRHRARRRPAADRPRPARRHAARSRSRCGWWSTPHGRTPEKARVRDAAAPTWIVTTAEVGAGPDGRVDLHAAARPRCSAGASARCCWRAARPWPARSSRAGLVDQVIGYVAPKLLGAGKAALVGRRRRHDRRGDRAGPHRPHADRPRPALHRIAAAEAVRPPAHHPKSEWRPRNVHRHRRGTG